ncbi:hypothetical protein JZ751_001321 [Albula glossodonta]|uniref:Uncharacterized protein n=1 Tax=Albula glossodonta TaxID=121402 RepID=A0A8T2PTL2_9TELE|nr:hypothetical protein JZ751_001321 [Albula glossodonta]
MCEREKERERQRKIEKDLDMLTTAQISQAHGSVLRHSNGGGEMGVLWGEGTGEGGSHYLPAQLAGNTLTSMLLHAMVTMSKLFTSSPETKQESPVQASPGPVSFSTVLTEEQEMCRKPTNRVLCVCWGGVGVSDGTIGGGPPRITLSESVSSAGERTPLCPPNTPFFFISLLLHYNHVSASLCGHDPSIEQTGCQCCVDTQLRLERKTPSSDR